MSLVRYARKIPVVVECIRARSVANDFPHKYKNCPSWMQFAIADNMVRVVSNGIVIKTLEGIVFAEFRDWIVRGVEGELYPVREDIFEKSYNLEGEGGSHQEDRG